VKVVDSSGWLEFFTDGPLAEEYEGHLADLHEIVTPAIVLYEVYKRIKRERTEEEAITAAGQIEKTRVVPITAGLALTAADLSIEHRLAMADALIYATAVTYDAELITSDPDFASLPGVTFLDKGRLG